MERRRQPRISWEGESIISGIVFTQDKFVIPTNPVVLKLGWKP